MGQFSTVPINKAVPSFASSLTRVREWWRKTFQAFISIQKKCSHLWHLLCL